MLRGSVQCTQGPLGTVCLGRAAEVPQCQSAQHRALGQVGRQSPGHSSGQPSAHLFASDKAPKQWRGADCPPFWHLPGSRSCQRHTGGFSQPVSVAGPAPHHTWLEHPGCWEQPEASRLPRQVPSAVRGAHACHPLPSTGCALRSGLQASSLGHSCPGAMLFSLFQKTKPRSPQGFI